MLLLIFNLKFDNQAGQIWARLASVPLVAFGPLW
jgi:hypothetical protein